MRTDGAFTLSAQNMAYENGSWWLPGVEVSGRSKTQCVWCGNYYYADEAADHVCMQECEYCHQLVDYFSYYEHIQKVHSGNSDDDNEKTYCAFCAKLLIGNEIFTHDCQHVIVPGHQGGNTSGGGGAGNGYGGGIVVIVSGGGEIGSTDDNNESNAGGRDSLYYQPRNGDRMVCEKMQKKWPPQKEKNDCVPVAMEYAAKLVYDLDDGRVWFKRHYKEMYNAELGKCGVIPQNMDAFVNYEFEANIVCDFLELIAAIDRQHPVLATLHNQNNEPHEVVIVGYNTSLNSYITYICIDPKNGDYVDHGYSDFLTGNYYKFEIRGENPNTNSRKLKEIW